MNTLSLHFINKNILLVQQIYKDDKIIIIIIIISPLVKKMGTDQNEVCLCRWPIILMKRWTTLCIAKHENYRKLFGMFVNNNGAIF